MFKIFYLIIGLIFSLPIIQASPPSLELIKKVENYLNGIQFLKADIIQTNPNQTQVKGKLWLKREKRQEGKMRLDYSPEVGQRLIAKDDTFIVYDLKEQTQDSYDLSYTPVAFLLKPLITFQKEVIAESVAEKQHVLEIVLVPKSDATGQSLTLFFSLYENGNIKMLEQWIVQDPQQQKTLVQLIPGTLSINSPKEVPDSLFNP